ncbi:MAG: SLBB domain-containing protein [Chitinophagaceae bacterium]|nr:SLBB domain-containing protein [Chitinophagaceae bacterium]
MNKSLIRRILFVFCLLFCAQAVMSQDLLKGKDLSQVKVDLLSDADIMKLKSQLSANGMSIDQAEQIALSKGMPASEFAKLKARVAAAGTNNNNQGAGKLRPADNAEPTRTARINNSPDSLDRAIYLEMLKRRPLIDSMIFGSELYTSVAPSFEPNLNLATPLNYILGPTDEINVSVYGIQQYDGNLTVSPEGTVSIPSVGQVKVAGFTIEEVTSKLKTMMANSAYPYLRTGAAKLAVTLTKIRTIRVNVIGANFPGNFNISSLSTVFNALYLAGGPNSFGSFREIELLRNGKLERKIDLYRFLLNGDQSDNVGLKDNDVIRIPTYKKRVDIQGQVKRPGIFEVLPGEHFSQVLAFASGFTDTAYRADIKVFQRNDRERKVVDLSAAQYDSYEPQSGDVFVVSKLLNRFENRVKITGAVFRPDVYALTPGLKVADLIRKADGLREDAFTGRGQILRLEDDLTRSIVSFDIQRALANDPVNNVTLRREDEVLIAAVQELRDTFKVTIQGEIRMPGQYEYVANLTVKDLILQAGGFTDAAYKNIEISRLLKRDSVAISDIRASEIISTQIDGDLKSAAANIELRPFDVVTVRRKAGYQLPESIVISGQVQFPGPYTLNSIDERVSSIYKRAGGAMPDANLAGAYIKRYPTKSEQEIAQNITRKVQRTVRDTSEMAANKESLTDFDQIPLNFDYILSHPGSAEDILLKSNDEIIIPKYSAQVRISRGVLLPTQIPYQQSYTVMDYISAAGGFSDRARKSKVFVVYPNGKAAMTRHFLFFRHNPKVLPGSEIIVPIAAEKRSLQTGEIIGIASALASLAGVVIAILRL